MPTEPLQPTSPEDRKAASDLSNIKRIAQSKYSGRRVDSGRLMSIESTVDQTTFQFWINPGSLQVRKPRIGNYTLTKAGFERYFFINDMWSFAYSGTSGVFVPESDEAAPTESNPFPENFDITTTAAWKKLEDLDRFYFERQEEDLRLSYPVLLGQNSLTGSLEDFSFKQDAKDPFQINYDFVFKGYPEASLLTTAAFFKKGLAINIDPGTSGAQV